MWYQLCGRTWAYSAPYYVKLLIRTYLLQIGKHAEYEHGIRQNVNGNYIHVHISALIGLPSQSESALKVPYGNVRRKNKSFFRFAYVLSVSSKIG